MNNPLLAGKFVSRFAAMTLRYTIMRAPSTPRLDHPEDFDLAPVATITHFHPKGSDHRPLTQVRVLHDLQSIYYDFRVNDRYVRTIYLARQASVWKDSCVEFFFQAVEGGPYINLEINAAGHPLMYCISDWRRTKDGFEKFERISDSWLDQVKIHHSLSTPAEKEIAGPVDWRIAAQIPLALVQAYQPGARIAPGVTWRANFHKCGDETSHPHFGTWSSIGEVLEFHQPDKFGHITFA